MNERLEAFLARIYVDPEARARFLADRVGEASRAGLDANAVAQLDGIDRVGLELAAASLERKRRLRAGVHDAEHLAGIGTRPG